MYYSSAKAYDKNVFEKLKLANDLYHALEKNEIELYYQPQVDALTDEIVGLEALLRWNNTDNGIVSPGKNVYQLPKKLI